MPLLLCPKIYQSTSMKNVLISLVDSDHGASNQIDVLTSLPYEFAVGEYNFVMRDVRGAQTRKNTESRLFHGELIVQSVKDHWAPYAEFISGNRLHSIFSFTDKSFQLENIERTALALGIKNFRHVEFSSTFDLMEFKKGTRYVAKPEGQANGKMQFLVDFKKVPIRELIDHLAVNELEELHAKGTHFSYGAAKQGNFDDKQDKCRQLDMIAEHKADLTGGFMVMELVENVAEEFRVITDGQGTPFISVKRNIVDTNAGFKQATGLTGGVPVHFPGKTLDKVSECPKEVHRLIKAMNTPLCGYDVYTTTDGKFGIFEYGIGWGISNVPHDPLVETVRQFYFEKAVALFQHLQRK